MSTTQDVLRESRRREVAQALFYRFLAGDAEGAGEAKAAERLMDLLADEQHHVSRLTARLFELGERVDEERPPVPEVPPLSGWEEVARAREADEVQWYRQALGRIDDEATRAVLEEILASERRHHEHLAGKWMPAGSGDPGAEE